MRDVHSGEIKCSNCECVREYFRPREPKRRRAAGFARVDGRTILPRNRDRTADLLRPPRRPLALRKAETRIGI